ncbi:MAG TPA: hypothetical protein VNS63_14805 [Blastocatellia bacterium]|nr:hypothetical protein [Blastocatellia bacterium]
MLPRTTSLLIMSALLYGSALGFQTAQTGSQPGPEEIIRRFTAGETQNKIARNNYTFTQDIDIMTIGAGGSITGRMRRTSDIVFDDRSNRIERITFFPPSSLTEVSLTQEDMQDLAGVQPFALTTDDLPKYQIDYIGKEKIDELTTYLFDVKPKQIIKGERYLRGKIWVDDRDLQIVKVAGQAVPEVNNQKFPHFESYRENIDGRYWFPTYVYADDVLEFKKGPSVHLRVVVRYTNYKKFGGKIRVADEGEPATDEDVKSTETKKPAPVKPPAPEIKKRP